MLKEFRDFAFKGNVLDLAVAVVMATTFAGVVKSAINDVLMPVIGLIVGKPNFDDVKIGEHIEVGKFITEFVNFIIVAFVLFLIIKAANKAMGGAMKGEVNEEVKDGLKDAMKEEK